MLDYNLRIIIHLLMAEIASPTIPGSVERLPASDLVTNHHQPPSPSPSCPSS